MEPPPQTLQVSPTVGLWTERKRGGREHLNATVSWALKSGKQCYGLAHTATRLSPGPSPTLWPHLPLLPMHVCTAFFYLFPNMPNSSHAGPLHLLLLTYNTVPSRGPSFINQLDSGLSSDDTSSERPSLDHPVSRCPASLSSSHTSL